MIVKKKEGSFAFKSLDFFTFDTISCMILHSYNFTLKSLKSKFYEEKYHIVQNHISLFDNNTAIHCIEYLQEKETVN